jgi:1,4-alpha-glucan branching enzyme
MTFGLLYAFAERFILPLSHDEVTHGKGSLYERVPGDEWQKLATLRAYFAFMWTHPGKKLLFMGGELGQIREWSHDREIDWYLLKSPLHAGLQRLVRDLNRTYAAEPALHQRDSEGSGFSWIVADDSENSVFVYERRGNDDKPIVVALNMTPVPREGYRFGVPRAGTWREMLNTDSRHYGGSDIGNASHLDTEPTASHGKAHSLKLNLPPLGALILQADS